MTNQTYQQTDPLEPATSFGGRLQAARKEQGLSSMEVAAQLRLNEKLILMIEKDHYPADLPTTFIHGYLRAYAKLLHIPVHEITQAIASIQIKPARIEAIPLIKTSQPVTSGHYFMQFFTYLVILTLFGLMGTWWYRNSSLPTVPLASSQSATHSSAYVSSINATAKQPLTAALPAVVEPPIQPIPANENNSKQDANVLAIKDGHHPKVAINQINQKNQVNNNVQDDDQDDDQDD
jgi:cytoskeleton protein RodZ